MALSDCGKQAAWMRNILGELKLPVPTIPIYADNQGSIFTGNNPVTEKRTKHIDIKYHYVRELIEDNKIEVFYIPTDANIADMLTKNLGPQAFAKHRQTLGLEFFQEHPAKDQI